MGVYINGMEMPKEGTVIAVYKIDGKLYATRGLSGRLFPLVPVPPHGRLIDADALMHEFEKAQRTMAQHGQEYSCSFMSSSQEISTEWYCVEDMLENAPTILEAEEGET